MHCACVRVVPPCFPFHPNLSFSSPVLLLVRLPSSPFHQLPRKSCAPKTPSGRMSCAREGALLHTAHTATWVHQRVDCSQAAAREKGRGIREAGRRRYLRRPAARRLAPPPRGPSLPPVLLRHSLTDCITFSGIQTAGKAQLGGVQLRAVAGAGARSPSRESRQRSRNAAGRAVRRATARSAVRMCPKTQVARGEEVTKSGEENHPEARPAWAPLT